jgi:uncharacterized protein YbjT (DUF2867 family)
MESSTKNGTSSQKDIELQLKIAILSGLIDIKYKDLSEQMQSRKEVGSILRTSIAEVTIFRAGVVLGQRGIFFQMLQYLLERLPVMVCPKLVLTKSQPISVNDMVTYLIKSIELGNTADKDFDMAGPEILSYVDMMKRYSAVLNISLKIVIIPFLTQRLFLLGRFDYTNKGISYRTFD